MSPPKDEKNEEPETSGDSKSRSREKRKLPASMSDYVTGTQGKKRKSKESSTETKPYVFFYIVLFYTMNNFDISNYYVILLKFNLLIFRLMTLVFFLLKSKYDLIKC